MALHAHRFIITGGPGSGKSTLLAALRAGGWPCFDEISRTVIGEQAGRGGQLYPWADLSGFVAECELRMCRQVVEAAKYPVSFFDRGLPDLIAYLRHGGLEPDPELLADAQNCAALAFLAPPWREIYCNDAARPQSFTEAGAICAQIKQAYAGCGITLCELPCAPVEQRLQFVRHRVEEFIAPMRAKPPVSL